ncbi:vWA domain-containing protein [Sphingomonas crocodyli]|uniref:VWA domain-containing protein n=1 Tax=Sphingomonas crocodyli TaxID=1979270 RepID=A0A437LYI4_9SPHN|nr:VWA domain-containing protein [Sphingomonas crocodyli]RVT90488.1 VWA domain-containing protein [Sphingomonas crocodyli]
MDIVLRSACALLVLAVCGCGGAKNDDPDNTRTSRSVVSASDVEDARAYIAQFISDNPDRCFAEVGLDRPELQRQGGDDIGPHVQPARVVIAIDGSGSMAGRIGGQTKVELARKAAARFVDGLPSTVETSLLVFGQQGDNKAANKARSCAGVDLLAPMSSDRGRLVAAISQVQAVGWTPLALGLTKARALLAPSSTPGEQIIYVVSDGEETCGGDPVAVARQINGGTTRAIVNIIGFGLPPGEIAALKAVSDAGGGHFVNLNSRSDYERTFDRIRESNRQASNAIRQSNAVAGNAVQTSNAISSASVCVSNIISSENVRLSNDLSARAVRGEPVSFARTSQAILKRRHDQMEARLKDYRAQLQDGEIRARRTIDAAAAAAR